MTWLCGRMVLILLMVNVCHDRELVWGGGGHSQNVRCAEKKIAVLLLLITFEPLELNQSFVPHLKVLTCGIDG